MCVHRPLGDKFPLDFAPTRWEVGGYLLDVMLAAASPHSPSAQPVLATVGAVGGGAAAASDVVMIGSFACSSSGEAALFSKLCEAVGQGVTLHVIQRHPHPVLLSAHFYNGALLPLLAQLLLTWMRRQGLVEVTDAQALRALEHGLTDSALQASLPDRHVKLLNLGSDWLRYLLPHTLRKVSRVHYGLLSAAEIGDIEAAAGGVPKSRRFLAVPFVGKDAPSLSSEFSHPDVAIGLTTLAYRYEGLRHTDFGLVLSHLQACGALGGGGGGSLPSSPLSPCLSALSLTHLTPPHSGRNGDGVGSRAQAPLLPCVGCMGRSSWPLR